MGMACGLDAGSPAITAAAAPYMRECEREGRSQGWYGADDVRQIRLCALLPARYAGGVGGFSAVRTRGF